MHFRGKFYSAFHLVKFYGAINAFCPITYQGVLHGSVVKCLTRNPGPLGSSRTGSAGFFRGSVIGQDTSEPQPSTDEAQERHE